MLASELLRHGVPWPRGAILVGMRNADSILKDALELPIEERIRIALELMESVDDRPSHPDAEEAWVAEVNRRIVALEAGTAKTMSAKDAIARARQRLRKK